MFSSAPAALEAPNVSGHSPEQNSGAGGGASTPSGSPPSAPSAKGKLRLRAGAGGDTEEIDAPVDMQRGVDPDDSGGLAGGHVAPRRPSGVLRRLGGARRLRALTEGSKRPARKASVLEDQMPETSPRARALSQHVFDLSATVSAFSHETMILNCLNSLYRMSLFSFTKCL